MIFGSAMMSAPEVTPVQECSLAQVANERTTSGRANADAVACLISLCARCGELNDTFDNELPGTRLCFCLFFLFWFSNVCAGANAKCNTVKSQKNLPGKEHKPALNYTSSENRNSENSWFQVEITIIL